MKPFDQFIKDGYPTITLYDNSLNISSFENHPERSINYLDIQAIDYEPEKIWWGLFDNFLSLTRLIAYGRQKSNLTITVNNTATYKYTIIGNCNMELASFLRKIIKKAKLDEIN